MHEIILEMVTAPSSWFVPAMNGNRAKCPRWNKADGNCGIRPPGPSRTGSQGNCSTVSAIAAESPANISVVFALRKQLKVDPDVAVEAQDETPLTKFCQSVSPRSAVNYAEVA